MDSKVQRSLFSRSLVVLAMVVVILQGSLRHVAALDMAQQRLSHAIGSHKNRSPEQEKYLLKRAKEILIEKQAAGVGEGSQVCSVGG